MNTRVTVIVVNWNSGGLLGRCLDHLSRQTVPATVLVLDNASSDRSEVSAEARGLAVRLVRMPSNLGFAAANNIGIRDSSTEFVALLNPDAFPEPDWLASLIGEADRFPGAAAFGSRQLRDQLDGILDGIGDTYHWTGAARREAHGVRQQARHLLGKEIFSPCAAAALYRREAVLAAGGFDEAYFCYMEDVDLGFRLRLAGHACRYVPSAVVAHVGSATTGGRGSNFSVYHGHRNLVWTFLKNMPGPLLALLLPLHLMLNLVELVWFSSRGQARTIWRAKRDAWRGLSAVWKKRRTTQAGRRASYRDIWRVLSKGWRIRD